MTITAGGGLSTIWNLNEALEDEFKAELDEEVNGASFLKFLTIAKADLLYPVLDVLVSYYNIEEQLFKFGELCLHVTLEDVLYLTGLPIRGKPVICETSRSRDKNVFSNLFGVENFSQMTHVELIKIAKDSQSSRIRKIAALLVLFSCIIIPSYDERDVKTTFVNFFESLEDVNFYAWGAALLAFLYSGLDGYVGGKNKSLKGNAWVLLSFFLIRIPKLASIVKVNVALENASTPLLGSIVEELKHSSYNHKAKYKDEVRLLLEQLTEDDIEWTPYEQLQVPLCIQNEAKFGILIAPIFCNNYVVRHRPHRVANQFRVLKGHTLSHKLDKMKIKIKKNSGNSEQNLKKHYKKQLQLWDEQTLAEDLISHRHQDLSAEAGTRHEILPTSSGHSHNEYEDQDLSAEAGTRHESHPTSSDHSHNEYEDNYIDSPEPSNKKAKDNEKVGFRRSERLNLGVQANRLSYPRSHVNVAKNKDREAKRKAEAAKKRKTSMERNERES